MLKQFLAILPMTNWISGYSKYENKYDKRLIKEAKLERLYLFGEEEDFTVKIEKVFNLSKRLSEKTERIVWFSTRANEVDMAKNIWTGTNIGYAHKEMSVDVYECGTMDIHGNRERLSVEELTAIAFRATKKDSDWGECSPRTFSILPVAKACQANCAFCFSKASISDEVIGKDLNFVHLENMAGYAKLRGATRAVITGGGEPTLMKPSELNEIITLCSKYWDNVLMITNAAIYGKMDEIERSRSLRALKESGLKTLAISRHGYTPEMEKKIMGISANASLVAASAKNIGLKVRAICVIQRGGIDSEEAILKYIDAMAADHIHEICFKELYVSSGIESSWASKKENQFSKINQVRLSGLIKVLEAHGYAKTGELPWGAPVFEGLSKNGIKMRIAAYTEPSVGWELKNKTVRSWNYLASNKTMASLEDDMSEVVYGK